MVPKRIELIASGEAGKVSDPMAVTRIESLFGHLGLFGLKANPLTGARLDGTGTGAGRFACFGFLASRLPRCWPLAMHASSVNGDRSELGDTLAVLAIHFCRTRSWERAAIADVHQAAAASAAAIA